MTLTLGVITPSKTRRRKSRPAVAGPSSIRLLSTGVLEKLV